MGRNKPERAVAHRELPVAATSHAAPTVPPSTMSAATTRNPRRHRETSKVADGTAVPRGADGRPRLVSDEGHEGEARGCGHVEAAHPASPSRAVPARVPPVEVAVPSNLDDTAPLSSGLAGAGGFSLADLQPEVLGRRGAPSARSPPRALQPKRPQYVPRVDARGLTLSEPRASPATSAAGGHTASTAKPASATSASGTPEDAATPHIGGIGAQNHTPAASVASVGHPACGATGEICEAEEQRAPQRSVPVHSDPALLAAAVNATAQAHHQAPLGAYGLAPAHGAGHPLTVADGAYAASAYASHSMMHPSAAQAMYCTPEEAAVTFGFVAATGHHESPPRPPASESSSDGDASVGIRCGGTRQRRRGRVDLLGTIDWIESVLRSYSGRIAAANLGSALAAADEARYRALKGRHGGLTSVLAKFPSRFVLENDPPHHHISLTSIGMVVGLSGDIDVSQSSGLTVSAAASPAAQRHATARLPGIAEDLSSPTDSEALAVRAATAILSDTPSQSLKAVELANAIRTRLGGGLLPALRMYFGGMLAVFERHPSIFVVERIPKCDTVSLRANVGCLSGAIGTPTPRLVTHHHKVAPAAAAQVHRLYDGSRGLHAGTFSADTVDRDRIVERRLTDVAESVGTHDDDSSAIEAVLEASAGHPAPLLPAFRRKASEDGGADGSLGPRSTRCLHVGNVAKGTTEARLRTEFGAFGAVEAIKLVSQHGRRYAFVSFVNHMDAERAKSVLSRGPWRSTISFAKRGTQWAAERPAKGRGKGHGVLEGSQLTVVMPSVGLQPSLGAASIVSARGYVPAYHYAAPSMGYGIPAGFVQAGSVYPATHYPQNESSGAYREETTPAASAPGYADGESTGEARHAPQGASVRTSGARDTARGATDTALRSTKERKG